MRFGLANAPATFRRALDVRLLSCKLKTGFVYSNDVIVFSDLVGEHHQHVAEFLRLLQIAQVLLKLFKCEFFRTTVTYLGPLVKPARLEIKSYAVKSLKEALPPRNKEELRSFLGVCNVYRRLVHQFAKIAGPLNVRLQKGEPEVFRDFIPEQ